MEEITKNLRTFLLENPAVSVAFGTKIYVVKAPDEPGYPFGIIRKVSPFVEYTQEGRQSNDDIIQIDVYDDDLESCVDNVILIESALDGYSGAISGVEKAVCFITQSHTEEWSPEARHYRSIIQVQIKWMSL